ncbi:MAG TPA: M20/M25/M40 family metallo-hydrolase [Thermoleophilaceae bacterium]|nr:M20/M25/M40 family metallo-hydrolase [Thermoleophilaceae bacterium]
MHGRGLDRLIEWLRIPSVSADPAHRTDIDAAAEWLARYIEGAGGSADLVETDRNPLVVGEWLPTDPATDQPPTVLLYGHYDVQPGGDPAAWSSPPFEPELRDGWLYGRGTADDKGPFFALLRAAEELAAERTLPVRVRVIGDGEEEILGESVLEFLRASLERPDACVIFDGPMPSEGQPGLVLGCRGLVYLRLRLRTGEKDLHSGFYGGAALNAANAMAELVAGISGEVPSRGVSPDLAGKLEREDHAEASGALARTGARPRDEAAGGEFVARTLTQPALDVHSLGAGSPGRQATVIPVAATADLSVRIVPEQDPEDVAAELERLLRNRCASGAEIEVDRLACVPPALLDSEDVALAVAEEALAGAFGVPVQRGLTGGTLPVVALLAEQGIPTIMTGIDVPSGNAHGPDERLNLEYLNRGIHAARAMLRALG